MSVKRYTIGIDSTGCCEQTVVEVDVNGEFVAHADYAALEAQLAQCQKDAERLVFLWESISFDEAGGIDVHEQASIYASALGRDEPNKDDYLAAYRDAIDAAIAAQGEK